MQSKIDMSRPNSLYVFGLFLLLLLSLLITNVPQLTLGHYVQWAFRPIACLVLVGLASIFALATYFQYKARLEHPWKVPQSLVQVLYALFFATTLGALVLIK